MVNRMNLINKSENTRSIVGVGLVCLDIVKGYGQIKYMTGGTCGNVISSLAFLGWESNIIKNRYNDLAGEIIDKNFNDMGVNSIELGTPVAAPRIIQIISSNNKYPRHQFLFACPKCHKDVPKIKTLTEKEMVNITFPDSNVFFTDRSSKGLSSLRSSYTRNGSWSIYEPNSCRNTKSFIESSLDSHIVKFSSAKVSFSLAENLRESSYGRTPVVIVRTEGPKGLSFCYKTRKGSMSKWYHLDALPAVNIIDTAGAGDWCTAGLLFFLVNNYPKSKSYLNKNDVIGALQFGQALSAISCSFMGSQGLLYNDLNEQLRSLLCHYEIPTIGASLSPWVGTDALCDTCLMPM